MEEIFRYQQLRQTQKLSEEQKLSVGLPLYPDSTLSELANGLTTTDRSGAKELLARYRKQNPGSVLSDESGLPATVRRFYDWLNFKARPIRKDDFKKFVDNLPPDPEFDLGKQWVWFADNFILSIYDKNISFNYCVDFQLLIRICYILRLCMTNENGRFSLRETDLEPLLASILELAILLPPKVLRSRCSDNCRDKGHISFPEIPTLPERGDKTPCECECDESCQKPNGHCICIKPYIGDLFVIKEELARYEEGDIADIENVLAGEMKVRRHRNLYRSEDSTETENETITNEERDHQASEKLSLQSEVKKTIDSKVGIDAGVTATVKYGESVTVTPHANVTASFSKSQSESLARSYAKEIVDRSVSKIQEKVRKVQISKIINEVEERNKHSIDNTQVGNSNRAGIYYWVNKVTHAQVFNYGKHMMFDVIVPEPAALFKKLMQLKSKKDNANTVPVKPILALSGITRTSYVTILNQYGLSGAVEPPAETLAIQFGFHQNLAEPQDELTTGFSSSEFKSEQIPDGYSADNFDYSISCHIGDPNNQVGSDEASVSVTVGRHTILSKTAKSGGLISLNDWSSAQTSVAMNGEIGVVTVSVAGYSSVAMSLSGTISIKCKLTDEGLDKWRVKIYNLVMDDYARKREAYEAAEKDKQDPLIQIKGRNPFLNREIERNEFKRHVVAMLLCNYFNGIGSIMERTAPCGYPEINFEKLEKDAPLIQFFEQVFEWPHLTYLFYHSMWARKCKWPDLIDEDSGDALFDKFLMAGAARVQIPVRPGMEDLFNWFLKTGQIWGASGVPPVSGDDEYVSMIQELKESKQGDYSDRPGLVQATNGSDVLKLTDSIFYWDFVNDTVNSLTLDNDQDRELLIDYKIYRIVNVEQAAPGDNTAWNILIERPYEDASTSNLKHAVGALFVGAPWEVVIPTKLVYLRNPNDKLPVYPLS